MNQRERERECREGRGYSEVPKSVRSVALCGQRASGSFEGGHSEERCPPCRGMGCCVVPVDRFDRVEC